MAMQLDMTAVRRAMQDAAKTAAGAEWPDVRDSVRRAIDGQLDYLQRLAHLYLCGELDEDTLDQHLARECGTVQSLLAGLPVSGAAIDAEHLHDIAAAAIGAFAQRVEAAQAARPPPAAPRAVKRPARKKGRRAAAEPGAEEPLKLAQRMLNARPDTVDFRDLMYVPTLVEVGSTRPLADYRKARVPILDQGAEGACTGFGLAAVVHYLLRTRKVVPDNGAVSPRMLYAMARRYDEWPGEAYDGSSCRGAMKGWHKHGVCRDALWRHDPAKPDYTLTEARSADAQARPLGAYLRVNHKDLVAMHAAISEVGILYASAGVHSGWDEVKADGVIPYRPGNVGGHAFAIVAYDEAGFWIQNSWSARWGKAGFCRISYEDWLENGTDVWVARLGVPIEPLARAAAVGASFTASRRAKAYAYDEVRPHIVSIGNDGQLRPGGNIGTSAESVRRLVHDDFPRITKGWKKKRLVLYAHGGLVSEDAAVQRVAEYRAQMLQHECYPLAFVWRSDYWSTLTNLLRDAVQHRRTEGVIDAAKDFMLDRLDDALEPLARKLTGKATWDEMKQNALAATRSTSGGAHRVAAEVAQLLAAQPQLQGELELHLVAHSAGAVLYAPFVRYLTAPEAEGGLGLRIESCSLWAPACTVALFESLYLPAVQSGRIGRFALYTLTDEAEQGDHCARLYNKSLLYLVSNAFEAFPRIPIVRPDGVPLLGMAKFMRGHAAFNALVRDGRATWVRSPNAKPIGEAGAAGTNEHGGFDDDKATVASTLAFVLGTSRGAAQAVKAVAQSYAPMAGAKRVQGLREVVEKAG